MDAKDLIDLQKAVFDGYITNVWQTLGMFLIAIGWVMTSDKARTFLKDHCAVRRACTSAAVAILLIHIGVLTASYKKSECLYINLMNAKISWFADAQSEQKMTFLDLNRIQMNEKKTFLDLYRIHWSYPIVSGLLSAILVSCFGVMLCKIGTHKTPQKTIDMHVSLL